MIYDVVSKYTLQIEKDPHHRFKSWEHCYQFFKDNYKDLDGKVELASLHLAFYLASWGMLRNSFLLQKDYLIHRYFIEQIVMNEKFQILFEESPLDEHFFNKVDELSRETVRVYKENILLVNGNETEISLTDTLVTKILLGVYGVAPAYDRYFNEAVRLHGISAIFNVNSMKQLIQFYKLYQNEFEKCQEEIGVHYPPMKLIDMYFWQVGFILEQGTVEEKEAIKLFAEEYEKHLLVKPKHVLKRTVNRNSMSTDDIRKYIVSLLEKAKTEGKTYIELVSGELHKDLGLKNALPQVCSAMRTLDSYKAVVIHETASTFSSTNRYGYHLNTLVAIN
ncbi:MAG TPA: hypothetical protein VNR38_01325 [Ureibacillus sp.]|nr:hypothetical protein [Ureibacillus sp.]